ncbi:TonB-dependent receptor [Flavobacterium sp.]|jgi:iron complex outermembrane receptor protein|uniref:TonB-dependent receptor n=1 Tax=Flavobacterium sp. TaxID=239 RepID=UPI0037C0A4A0
MQKFSLVFCFLCFGVVFSQNTISGKIVNENDVALEKAHIHIASKSTLSKKDGFYSLSNIPNGQVKILITYVGYKSIDTLLTINGNLELNFQMKVKREMLDDVVVKHKDNYHNLSVNELKIKEKTIDKYSSQSLGNVLKEVSGISILKSGSTIVKPVINGLHSSRVGIYNNNVKLEDQQWGMEHAPNLDVNAAGKISVIKGASALQYGGDAIGGIVIVDPISIKKDTLIGKTIVTTESNGRGGTISSSLHKGNFCDWSWNAQGSFKYYGDRESPDYVLSNTGNREANFSGDVKYIGKKYDFSAFYSLYNATIGILSASHIGNVTDLYNSINNQTPSVVEDFTYSIKNPKQKVQHHLAKLNYNYYLKDGETISFQYAFQFNNRKEFDLRTGVEDSRPALDLDLMTHSFNADYKLSFDAWDVKSGVMGLFQNNSANPNTGVRPLIPSYNKFDAGIYAIVDNHISEHFSIEAGVRYDFSTIEATKYYLKSRWTERNYSPEFDSFIVEDFGTQWLTKPRFTFHNFSASLGTQYSFGKDYELYFNVSHAVRNPNPSEFFSDGLHHSSGMIELGDLRLKQEKSNKISTSLSKKFKNFSANFSPFLNYIEDYMFLRPVGFETTIRGAFPVWEYQQTNALLTGIDFNSDWKITEHWQHRLLLSYVSGRDKTNDDAIIDMPPLNISNRIQFSKKEWSNLSLELQSEMVFRQTLFPNNNFDTNIVVDGELFPVEVNISQPPSAYHLLHFSSEIQLKTFKNSLTTIGFSVFNLLNTKYRDYLNRQRFYADEMGRNFQIQLKFNY